MFETIKAFLALTRAWTNGEIPRTLDDPRICKPIWQDWEDRHKEFLEALGD